MTWQNKENFLRTVRMENPSFMPYNINLYPPTWFYLKDELADIVRRHPKTWPNPDEVIWDWKNPKLFPWEDPEVDFVDHWGCVWKTANAGYMGTVVKRVLADISKLDTFKLPDAETYNGGYIAVDWKQIKENMNYCKSKGLLARGIVDHGFYLLRLEYLRGFENFVMDMADDTDEIKKLVNILHELNKTAVRNWIDAGAELIDLPEDQGSQNGSLIGPVMFRKWVLPYLKELHEMIQNAGIISRFHTDGNIMDIADQICKINPSILNPQDKANGIEELAKAFKGRLCIDLDFDRQHTLPFGTPQEIRELLEYEIKTLGSPSGGLVMQAEIQGEIPAENIEAFVSGLEELCTYWFE